MPAIGTRLPSSARTSESSSCPTTTMGQVQIAAGPKFVIPKPKLTKMPVVIEITENEIVNIERKPRDRLSCWRYPKAVTVASSASFSIDMTPSFLSSGPAARPVPTAGAGLWSSAAPPGHGVATDSILLDVESATENGRDGDGSVRLDVEGRLDEVLGVEDPRGRHVGGQREVRKGGEGEVEPAADAGFQHPPTPDRHRPGPAEVVDLGAGDDAADSRRLDVDDAARPEPQRGPGDPRRARALVEADGGAQGGLQIGEIAQRLGRQRLLDHQQSQLVQLRPGAIPEPGISAVAIDAQGNTRKPRRHRTRHLDVPARCDLELDATVALRQPPVDLPQQLVHRILDAEALTHRDPLPHATPQLAQSASELLRSHRPGRALERVHRPVVALQIRPGSRQIRRALEGPAGNPWGQETGQRIPAAVVRVRSVGRD